MREITRHDRGVPIGGRRRFAFGQDIDAGLVAALRKADLQPPGHLPLARVAAAAARRADPDQIDRAVADVVIAVAAEILGREFPVARDQPFLHAADDFAAALAAVPAIERQVEIPEELAEIVEKRRRRRVPGRPHRSLVAAQLRDFDETPLRPVESRVIGLAKIGDADQPSVGAIAPAVIRAGEDGCVALVVTAHLHAAVAARIEENVHVAGPVAAQDHRFLAHARDGEIPGLGDLALMADKEPSAGEHPLQFLLVDRLVDKDLAADLAARQIDHAGPVTAAICREHGSPRLKARRAQNPIQAYVANQ
jgi:hypothetical protein